MLFKVFVKNTNFTNFINFDMQKCRGVTSSIAHRKMKQSLLEPSLQDASNGGIYMSLASTDGKLFAIFCLATFRNISLSIGPKVT